MANVTAKAAALQYLARGWAVIPLEPKGKRPIVAWHQFHDERPTREQITVWFDDRPRANLGIVTGKVSGLVVIDVDPQHGGQDSLADLESRHGPLPDTVECRTGGGGRHLYFRHPDVIVRNRVGFAPGLDVRGDGGMVVAPPSNHPSGRSYAWVDARGPDDIAAADLPGWLKKLIAALPEGAGHPLTHWRTLAAEGVAEGQRNSTLASFAGHLLWHGVDRDVVLELLLCWNRIKCRPPLPDREVASVVDSIDRLHQR